MGRLNCLVFRLMFFCSLTSRMLPAIGKCSFFCGKNCWALVNSSKDDAVYLYDDVNEGPFKLKGTTAQFPQVARSAEQISWSAWNTTEAAWFHLINSEFIGLPRFPSA